ncbi:MAG: YbjQ family protein [Thermoleophilia bacterium]
MIPGAGIQTAIGGKITCYEKLCEQTREESFEAMLAHADVMGVNAAIGVRNDTTEVMSGVTEVLYYGTVVVVEPK